jgi:(p)ppGpp synthase/HD superfamily hydrolase
VENIDALYEQLGLGERLAPMIAGLLAAGKTEESNTIEQRKPIEVAGTEGLVVSYAKCCSPIPGDEIVGFMSSGRGIVIHHADCGNLADYRRHPSKWIPVSWRPRIKGEFSCEIHVRTMDRLGLLAELAARISATQSNIDTVQVDSDDDSSTLTFRLKVRDRKHLAQVLRSVRSIPGVVRVTRNIG